MDKLLNFILFQIGWFSAVLGGASGRPWFGVIVICFIVLFRLSRVDSIKEESTLILIIAVTGGLLDSIFVYLGWISYPSGHINEYLTTYWIIAMWMSFATTLNSSMAWLKKSKLLSSFFGFFGGPLTYYGGYKLNAIQFSDFNSAMIGLAFGWAVIIPLLLILADSLYVFFHQNNEKIT